MRSMVIARVHSFLARVPPNMLHYWMSNVTEPMFSDVHLCNSFRCLGNRSYIGKHKILQYWYTRRFDHTRLIQVSHIHQCL